MTWDLFFIEIVLVVKGGVGGLEALCEKNTGIDAFGGVTAKTPIMLYKVAKFYKYFIFFSLGTILIVHKNGYIFVQYRVESHGSSFFSQLPCSVPIEIIFERKTIFQ